METDATKPLNELYTAADRSRLLAEEDEAQLPLQHPAWRDDFDRDYARVLHSASLRRLRNKAQLFPASESDVFRTRLTHSFEVAQIAQALACQANSGLSRGLLNMAGLAHDIGHPPFGRNGERALNEWMREAGGFEGNAQTLRVLARLEKKRKGFGLNLTCRALAAIIKKDKELGELAEDGTRVKKGYYHSERKIVRHVRLQVLGKHALPGSLRTIECSIMDAADDIAFSTSDLEDSLKGGFMSVMDMLACSHQLAAQVAQKIRSDPEAHQLADFTVADVRRVLRDIAAMGLAHVSAKKPTNGKIAPGKAFDDRSSDEEESSDDSAEKEEVDDDLTRCDFHFAATTYRNAKKLAENARYRTAFTSELVKTLMAGVSIVPRERACLSEVAWDRVALERVMVLKHFTFFFVIKTPALQAFETNGRHVVSELCRLLWADPEGNKLPPDCRARFAKKMVKVLAAKAELAALLDAENVRNDGDGDAVLLKRREELQKRVRRWEARAKRDICDFVAGMTDNYAVEFYGRLTSLTPTTIHKKP